MGTMVTGFGHTAYNVKDMEKSLKFYHDVLGFEKAFELRNQKTGEPWIEYIHAGGSQFIELFYTEEGAEKQTGEIGYNHLCLEVKDIHEIVKRIEEAGAPLDAPVKIGTDKNWQCWTHDPDGNRIELMQMGEDSMQKNYLKEHGII